MIKTTIKNIKNAKTILQNLSVQSLPIKTSYGIAKVIKAANVELATYEEQRIKLCEKYGTLNKGGTEYNLNDIEGFEKEFTELINIEVELNANPIKLTDEIRMSAQDILALDGLVEVIEDD